MKTAKLLVFANFEIQNKQHFSISHKNFRKLSEFSKDFHKQPRIFWIHRRKFSPIKIKKGKNEKYEKL